MAQSPHTDAAAGEPLDFSLDRDSDLPLGAQLARRVRALIESGRLREGDRLPAVREMASLAGVNVNTVRSVYGRLAKEGAIVSEHGRGTFVAEGGAPTGSDPAPAGQGFAAEARQRAALRTEIAVLERELALVEVPNGEQREDIRWQRPPTPQLLTAADLEAIRDELAERLHALRGDRTSARRELEGERHERAQAELVRRPQRAVATGTPKFETGSGGGWSLRWRG
jgi:DNA-binding transcriptional regulator YhcF (GntR family)